MDRIIETFLPHAHAAEAIPKSPPKTVSNRMMDFFSSPLGIFTSAALIGFGTATFLKKFNLPLIWTSKIDTKSKKNGGENVAKVLKSHGVQYVFTLSGGHISPILVECEKLGIKVVDTRHEVNTVFAADAVARLSGNIGVAAVTAGPGVTNTITAMKNAQMAESPVLLLGGAASSLLKGRGSLQDIDQLSLFKPVCKYAVSVKTIRDIIPTLKKAIQIAQSDLPGPVFVELPIDTLYPYDILVKEILKSGGSKSTSLKARITNWYLNNYMNNLFAKAWDPVDVSPISPNIPKANWDTVHKCANMLAEAKKPVIVMGSQTTLPPTPVEEVRKSLEAIGVPCFLGGMSRGLLGANSDIQMRQNRKDALQEADLIILAGAICDFRLSYGRSLGRNAKIISVNRSKEQANKNSDMFWKPTMTVEGDVGTFINDLASVARGYECPKDWISTLRSRDEVKEAKNLSLSQAPADIYINPMKLLFTLEDKLPNNAILVADGGDFVATASYILRPRGPLKWLDPGAFGTLGVGGGFALGAKLVRPESEVWIIYGDGSCGYSLLEFDTFLRHKVAVIGLIGNDACWTQIAREQMPMFNSAVACNLIHAKYHEAGAGLGAKGILLDKPEDIERAITDAQEASRQGKAVVINALIGKTSFREGSISV